MKKLFSLLAVCLLFAALFSLSASAGTVTFSDDFSTLTHNGHTYFRFNDTLFDTGWTQEFDGDVHLTVAQQQEVAAVTMTESDYSHFLFAELRYHDGATLSAAYLREDYRTAYNQLMSGQFDSYRVDFAWPQNNTVPLSTSAVSAQTVTLTEETLEWADFYYTDAGTADGALTIYAGMLVIADNAYYYADFAENRLTWESFSGYLPDHAPLLAHPITDADALAALAEGYANTSALFPFGNNVLHIIAIVFLTLLFAVFPLAVFIVCLILSARATSPYKELFTIACILSVAVLVIFALVTLFLL